jgi:hypothetical protein
VFRGWHGEASLWREIYARTVSALIAAFVIYLVAALAGVVDKKPAIVVSIAVLALGGLLLLFSLKPAIVHRAKVGQLFHTWNEDPHPDWVLARRVYGRIVAGLLLTFVGLLFLLAL